MTYFSKSLQVWQRALAAQMRWNELEASEFILRATIYRSHLPASRSAHLCNALCFLPGKAWKFLALGKKRLRDVIYFFLISRKHPLNNLGWPSEPGRTGDKAKRWCKLRAQSIFSKKKYNQWFSASICRCENKGSCGCKTAHWKEKSRTLSFLPVLSKYLN